MERAVSASPEHSVLIDRFLEDAIEVDVDAVSDGKTTVIGAIMEHIEQAGIHSGDSACVIPTHTLSKEVLQQIREYTYTLSKALKVIGLMNIQYAIKGETVYVLEVNPRASRTVPYVSKTIGIPLAKIAARVMTGKTLAECGFTQEPSFNHLSVKEAVLPFVKFPGVDILLGPEMKSTGEVMGLDMQFGNAFAKSQMAASSTLPHSGTVFISVNDKDKEKILSVARRLRDKGFNILATRGTAQFFKRNNVETAMVLKVNEGTPNVVDAICKGEIQLIINTPLGAVSQYDEKAIRQNAITHSVPVITTIAAASAAVDGIEAILSGELTVRSLQEYHAAIHYG